MELRHAISMYTGKAYKFSCVLEAGTKGRDK